MKRFFMTAAIIGATLTAGFAQETARVETKSFESEYFPFPREILIYTPESYDEATENDYDVIYVFDSQHRSRFDLVHSLMHYGIQQDEENPLSYIVVGITSPDIPEYSHNMSYHHALTDALQDYAAYCHDYSAGDTTLYPVHLEVSAQRLEGDVYVTGNQPALADWNPEGVKMTKIADNTYALDLELTLPAEFKFTQGSWETQLFMKNATRGNLRITDPERADKHYRAYTFNM